MRQFYIVFIGLFGIIKRISILPERATMIFISTRESLTNSHKYAGENYYYDIDFTDSGMTKTKTKTLASLRKSINGKRVLLLIHGYNNDFLDVSRAYSIIEKNFAKVDHDYDEIVGFTWPGGNEGYEYLAAKRRSSVAASRLQGLFNLLNLKAIDVMTHSMGARVVLRALCELPADGPKVIRHHFSTAAAIDDESIEKGKIYYDATQLTRCNWIFHSKRDDVLKYWYRIGDLDTALGLHGPDDRQAIERYSKNVNVVNCRHHVNQHGGYKNTTEIYNFISNILLDKIPKSRQFFTL